LTWTEILARSNIEHGIEAELVDATNVVSDGTHVGPSMQP
jgi:hypothetical protein